MSEGGEARNHCGRDDCITPDCLNPYCSRMWEEGARNHEAMMRANRNHEIETVARALEPHMNGGPMTLKRAANSAITALDAVRRSPQDEQFWCPDCGAC